MFSSSVRLDNLEAAEKANPENSKLTSHISPLVNDSAVRSRWYATRSQSAMSEKVLRYLTLPLFLLWNNCSFAILGTKYIRNDCKNKFLWLLLSMFCVGARNFTAYCNPGFFSPKFANLYAFLLKYYKVQSLKRAEQWQRLQLICHLR